MFVSKKYRYNFRGHTYTYYRFYFLRIDGNVKNLDPMNIDCGSKAINQFSFNSNAMRFNYKCAGGTDVPVSGPETRYTDWQDGGDNGLNYLDRHFLNCGDQKFISAFDEETQNVNYGVFNRQSKVQIRFRYQCRQWPSSYGYSGRDVSTSWQDKGPDNRIVYLDRQNVQCNANEGLSNFGVQSSGNNIKFNYRCASIMAETSAPTMVPTSSPTAGPTPVPTAVPSATPTMRPTSGLMVLGLDGLNYQSGKFDSEYFMSSYLFSLFLSLNIYIYMYVYKYMYVSHTHYHFYYFTYRWTH